MSEKPISYQCKNCNQFYNAAKYDNCPYCDTPKNYVAEVSNNTTAPEEKEKVYFAGVLNNLPNPFKKDKNNVEIIQMEDDPTSDASTFGKVIQKSDEKVLEEPTKEPEEEPDFGVVEEDDIDVGGYDNDISFNVTPSVAEDDEEDDEPTSLSNSITTARETSVIVDDEKTSGYFKINREKNNTTPKQAPSVPKASSAPAVAPVAESFTDEPVVGWLVGINGPYLGQSVKMFAGRNSIGRNPGNHIVLSADKGVSREKHAWITYEPKKREFFIQPGDSSGLTYLNEDAVMETNKLQKNDVVGLGTSKFVFIPLCGEDFTWDDYID